jgi:hypothetical protein
MDPLKARGTHRALDPSSGSDAPMRQARSANSYEAVVVEDGDREPVGGSDAGWFGEDSDPRLMRPFPTDLMHINKPGNGEPEIGSRSGHPSWPDLEVVSGACRIGRGSGSIEVQLGRQLLRFLGRSRKNSK